MHRFSGLCFVLGKLSPCSKVEERTPRCSKECEAGYSVSYKQDKHFGMSANSFRSPEAIQTEIMTNGPVEGTMRVYEDFLTYKSGLAPVFSLSPKLDGTVDPH